MLANPAQKYRPFAPFAQDFAERTWPSRRITQPPIWMSTDLRDGNQSLIEPMSIERKLRFFEQLVKIGFKEIEVGFPSASQTDFDFVRKLIDETRIPDDVAIIVLTQSREDLIARTVEAAAGARRAIVHLYNAVAPAFRKIVFNMSKDEIRKIATTGTELVKAAVARHPETKWGYEYLARGLQHDRTGIRAGGGQRGIRRLAADAHRQDDRQPAGHDRGDHPQSVRRPDRMDVHRNPARRDSLVAERAPA